MVNVLSDRLLFIVFRGQRISKEFLGHKSLKSTEIYITIERTIFEPSNDEYTVKIAKDPKDIKDLLEAGFEYVCNKEELVFLRKRK